MSGLPYSVLLIGCGNIAGGFDSARAPELPPLSHAGAYTRHGGFRLLACTDPDENRRQTFVQRWGVSTHASELTALAAQPGTFDVISICSPTALHHEHLEQALALRPRVIFCEKPLTSEMEAATRLVQDCSERGVQLVVNYSRRWDPAVADLASQLKAGRWGEVRSVVGFYNKGILNNGGHMVDLLMSLVGPLELVSATCAEFDFWETDPTVAALLCAERGKVPVYLSPGNARDFAYFELELVCELGVFRMHSGGLGWHLREVVPSPMYAGYKTLDAVQQREGRYLETMMGAISEIHAHLQSGTPLRNSGAQALSVQGLCTQIQRQSLLKLERTPKD